MRAGIPRRVHEPLRQPRTVPRGEPRVAGDPLLELAVREEMRPRTADLLDRLSEGEAFGRAAEPWEIAATIAFLASDYSSYLTGEVISVSSQRA